MEIKDKLFKKIAGNCINDDSARDAVNKVIEFYDSLSPTDIVSDEEIMKYCPFKEEANREKYLRIHREKLTKERSDKQVKEESETFITNLSLAENVAEIMDRHDVTCPLETENCKNEVDNLLKTPTN